MRHSILFLTLLFSSITVPAFGAANEAPIVSISGGDRTFSSDAITVTASLSASAVDTDGEIKSTSWLIGGKVFASGLSTEVLLCRGVTTISFRAEDDKGASSLASVELTHENGRDLEGIPKTTACTKYFGATGLGLSDSDGLPGEIREVGIIHSRTDTGIGAAPKSTSIWLNGEKISEQSWPPLKHTVTLRLPDGNSLVCTQFDDVFTLSCGNYPVSPPSGNTLPTALIFGQSYYSDYFITDTDGLPGETVSLSATATDPDGSVISTEWLLDGTVVATGTSPELRLDDGRADLLLKVIDDEGAVNFARASIKVVAPVIPNIAPMVRISGGSRSVIDTDCRNTERVMFEATASDTDGEIVSRLWLIDGEVVAQETSRPYLTLIDGSSTVTFRATDDDGDSTDTNITVSVIPPRSNFSNSIINIGCGDRSIFDDDGIRGEVINFRAPQEVVESAASSWLVENKVVATGTSADLELAPGNNLVTYRTVNYKGEPTTINTNITLSYTVPRTTIRGRSRTITDTDGLPGEVLAVTTSTINGEGGVVESISWLVDGEVVASGMSANLPLRDGANEVTLKVTYDDGDSSVTRVFDDGWAQADDIITVTVSPPGVSENKPTIVVKAGSKILTGNDPSQDSASVFMTETEMLYYGNSINLEASFNYPDESMVSTQWVNYRGDIVSQGTSLIISAENRHLYLGFLGLGCWPMAFQLIEGETITSQGFSVCIIPDPNFKLFLSLTDNSSGGSAGILDTDGKPGEWVAFNFEGTDIVSNPSWTINGVAGISAGSVSYRRGEYRLFLPDGNNQVTASAKNRDGVEKTKSMNVAVAAPEPSNNGFYLDSNLLTIKNIAGGVTTTIAEATLGSNGVLTTSGANLPRIDVDDGALTDGIPSFEFTINTDGLDASSANTFKIGISIVDDSSPNTRRFEAYISNLTLAVAADGTTVTGTIPSQAMNVLAKKGSATFYQAIQNSKSNGPVIISGGTLSFNGEEAVTLLKAAGNDILDAVIDDFTLSGVFTFRIVIEEISNGGAKVGTISGPTFTAVPRISASCDRDSASTIGNIFKLTGDAGFSIADQFTNPYVIQGRFSSNQDADNIAATAFTEICTASASGGSDGSVAPVVEEETDVAASESEIAELDDVLDNIADTDGPLSEAALEQVDELNTALGTLAEELNTKVEEEIATGEVSEATVISSTNLVTKSTLATSAITKSLASGGVVSKTSLLGALTSGAKSSATASKVGKATTSTEAKAALVTQNKTILTNSATMLSSLASDLTELTIEEAEEVKTVARNLVSTSNSLAESNISTTDLKEIATQTSDMLLALADLEIAADTALIEAVSEASEAMATSVITQELSVGGTAPTTEQITEALTNNSTLFDNVLEASIPLPPAEIITEVERNDRIAAARPSITPEVQQAILNATKKVVRPNTIVLNSGKSALTTLLDFLTSPAVSSSSLLGSRARDAVALTTELEITSDETTGLLTISSGTETYVGMVLGVRSVPAAVPNGIRFRKDGRATVVTEGTAIDIASNAFSFLDFIGLAETFGFSFEQNIDASFTLNLGEGQTFEGTHAYDNLVSADLNAACGELNVTEPAGARNAASYLYSVNCASGVSQRVVPFTANTNFFQSMQARGMTVSVDRNTGVISVSDIGLLKPSFFTSRPTESELVYHAAETDAFGIAVQIIDLNNDGINDYKVISATSVQIMYGLN